MNRPLRASLIGSSRIADIHAAAMRSTGIELVGVYSTDAASAAAFAQKHRIRCYRSPDELMTDDIDFAAVCTPSGTHCALAVSLMEHGKHAVTEKPVVLTRKEAVRLLETDTTHGRILIRIPRSLRGLRHSAGTEAAIERK